MLSGLISAAGLAAHRDAPDWVLLDCRFDLLQPEAGRRAFAEGHIPGSRYAHLERDLSGPVSGATGRHPLPEPAVLAETFGAWGIDETVQVVVYDALDGAYAARAWWLLHWLGHPAVAVLDGGFQAWCAAGLPVTPEEQRRPERIFHSREPRSLAVTTEQVAAALGSDAMQLWDARAAVRFRGEQEPIDPVGGHIPLPRTRLYTDNLQSDGHFLDPGTLRRAWRQVLGDTPSERVVHYCGSGVTACHNLLAMEIAGLSGSRLYAGSWSEWIRDPTRPVAVGD